MCSYKRIKPIEPFFLLHCLYIYCNFVRDFIQFKFYIVIIILSLLLFRNCNEKVIATIISHIINADGNDAEMSEQIKFFDLCLSLLTSNDF